MLIQSYLDGQKVKRIDLLKKKNSKRKENKIIISEVSGKRILLPQSAIKSPSIQISQKMRKQHKGGHFIPLRRNLRKDFNKISRN